MKISLNKRIGLEGWIYFLCLLLFIPLATVLPRESGWENHSLENLQIAVLAIGMLLSIYYGVKDSPGRQKAFWFTVAGVCLLMISREMSWGRIFFPLYETEMGPSFARMKNLTYGKLVEKGIGVFFFLLVVGLCVFTPWKRLFQVPLPVAYLVLFLLCLVVGRLGELGFIIPDPVQGQVLEEGAELIAYFLIVRIIQYYWKALKLTVRDNA